MLLLWFFIGTEEVVSKISVQLEKSKKDLPAFDVVENLVEEEVLHYVLYTTLYVVQSMLWTIKCSVYHSIFILDLA